MTDQTTAASAETGGAEAEGRSFPVGRTLMWLGIAGASAALTYAVLRFTVLRRAVPASDETTERIQSLIDEANRLIKALDEKKSV